LTSLFTGDIPQIDPNQDYLVELVGEGKKYRDPQALALSKVHADRLIEDLKKQLEETQQELQTRARLEELLTKATTSRNEVVEPTPAYQTQTRTDEPVDALTAEKLARLISDQIGAHEATRVAGENVRLVKKTLVDQFGPGYEEVVAKAAQAAGVTTEWLEQQAQSNPRVVLSLVSANAPRKETFVNPPTSKLSPDIAPQTDERTWAYYQKVKAKDPSLYESKEVQVQMHKDALRLKERFFVTN
jgi:hypothetical protein